MLNWRNLKRITQTMPTESVTWNINWQVQILQFTYYQLPPPILRYPMVSQSNWPTYLNFLETKRNFSTSLPRSIPKLAGESSDYINAKYKLCYVYGFLKGNVQNQIQPYILPDKIKLENIESLISMLEATFCHSSNFCSSLHSLFPYHLTHYPYLSAWPSTLCGMILLRDLLVVAQPCLLGCLG
jgi:hypothetical protein